MLSQHPTEPHKLVSLFISLLYLRLYPQHPAFRISVEDPWIVHNEESVLLWPVSPRIAAHELLNESVSLILFIRRLRNPLLILKPFDVVLDKRVIILLVNRIVVPGLKGNFLL